MKILIINKFLYPKGGDAISSLNTGELLKSKGHNVIFWGMKDSLNPFYQYQDYFVSNIEYNQLQSFKEKISATLNILYSFEAKRKVEDLIRKIKPDIAHLNNFAHQLSPSILDVFTKYKIPTIMTMRDYKLVCPSYSMFSDGKPCEKCKAGKYYWCFFKKCTKNSYAKSLLNVMEMYLHHQILHLYDLIDIFISPSVFLKNKLKEMGFKKEIVYLPNLINIKDYIPNYNLDGRTLCYFGRFSREKGLVILLEAIKGIDISLKIIGDGPVKKDLELRAKSLGLKNVSFLAHKSGEELKKEIISSMAVILPSECYENNPRIVLEAFALGKPVIGSRIGGIPELVQNGETGLTFEPGNVEDLKNKIEYLIRNPDKISEMGRNARKFVEENFNPEKHYQDLMKIYQMAREKCK
ncbi:MAG: glycosyltransferase family 4 protein [Candidatus Edwardsbacteria bacterium]